MRQIVRVAGTKSATNRANNEHRHFQITLCLVANPQLDEKQDERLQLIKDLLLRGGGVKGVEGLVTADEGPVPTYYSD